MRPQCFIIILIIGCLAVPNVYAQELRDLSIQRFDEIPEMPTVMADYPDQAYIVFLSSITSLQFESNWIIYDDLSEPKEGRYILVVDTVRQVLRISVPDEFRAAELNIPKLESRQTLYYTIQPANARQLELARDEFERRDYEHAIERLNSYVLISNLTATQRARAYQLSALCFFELGLEQNMNQALYKLMQFSPDYLPDVIANPPPINDFIAEYRDSVYQAVPSRPQQLSGEFREGAVQLRWALNQEHDIAQYNIFRANTQFEEGSLLSVVEADTENYTDASVAPFQKYYYYLRAVDNFEPAHESIPSRIFSIETLPALIDRMEAWESDGPVEGVAIQEVSDSTFAFVYDLSADIRRTFDVTASLSNNEGNSFSIIPHALSGDIGANIQDGDKKQIFWNVLADFPGGLPSRSYLLKIEAIPQPLVEQIKLVVLPDSVVTHYSLMAPSDSSLTISYTLEEQARQRYRTELSFSREANSTYGITPLAVEGDLGKNKKGGKNYQITWRLLEDFPDGLDSNLTLVLRPVLQPKRNRHFLYLATGGAAIIGGTIVLLNGNGGKNAVASNPPGRP